MTLKPIHKHYSECSMQMRQGFTGDYCLTKPILLKEKTDGGKESKE